LKDKVSEFAFFRKLVTESAGLVKINSVFLLKISIDLNRQSTIINTEEVARIEPWYNNSYWVDLNGIEKPTVMSCRYLPSAY